MRCQFETEKSDQTSKVNLGVEDCRKPTWSELEVKAVTAVKRCR